MKGGASNGQPAARISILARLAGLTSCHRSRKSPTVQSYCWSIAGSHSFLRRAKELVSIPHKISPSRPIFRLQDLEDTMGGGGKVFNRDLKFANRIESRYWTVLRAGGGAVSSGERPVRFTWWGIMERRKSGFFFLTRRWKSKKGIFSTYSPIGDRGKGGHDREEGKGERERNRDRIIIRPGLSRIDRGERIDRWLFIKRTMNLFARAQWIRMEYINWNNYTRHLLNFTW